MSFSIFFILGWFSNILENNNVTLSDDLEVGYYVTLCLIMYADDAALLQSLQVIYKICWIYSRIMQKGSFENLLSRFRISYYRLPMEIGGKI